MTWTAKQLPTIITPVLKLEMVPDKKGVFNKKLNKNVIVQRSEVISKENKTDEVNMYLYVRNLCLKSFHNLSIKLTFIVFSIKMQIIYVLSVSIVKFGLWFQINKNVTFV